jgi:hypothetical protein
LKEKLSKKYAGIPLIAIMVLVMVTGTVAATAGYLVYKDTTKSTIKESVKINKKKGLSDGLYPNEKIGDRNGCAKYAIINKSPATQHVIVDIVEENSNIDEMCSWYGLSVVPSQHSWASNSVASYDLGHISKGPGTAKHTYSLNLGTVTYEVGPSKPDPEEDSNYWRVFVDGKLKGSVKPGELKVQVKIFRN